MKSGRLGRGAAGLLLLTALGACAQGGLAERELQSLEARMRMGIGDLGTPQDEAAARAAELPTEARLNRPGDRYVYSDERVEVVRAVEGLVVVWDEGPDELRTATVNPLFPFFRRETSRYDRVAEVGGDPPAGLWPLGGDQVRAYNSVVSRTDRRTGEVARFPARRECAFEAPTTADTPLGRYTTLPVICRSFAGRRLTPSGSIRFDLVPALGHWVRMIETTARGAPGPEVYLLGIEPGSWLGDEARRQLGQALRRLLEERPSGEMVSVDLSSNDLSGYLMAAATYESTAVPGRYCRAYTITIADPAGRAVDYPGTSCRIRGEWRLPAGF